MAKVFLLSVMEESPEDHSWSRGAYTLLKESADIGKSTHRLVEDPAEADIILFAEQQVGRLFLKVRRHPLVKQFREKCFVFDSDDLIIPFLPGVYASIEKSWYSPSRVRSGFYISITSNPFLDHDPEAPAPDFLFCFQGSVNTSPVRAALSKLEHPRSFFLDTSRESLPILTNGSAEERAAFFKRFAQTNRRSKFVLCPRGMGSSSTRLFEAMRQARAPVIVADEWVPPEGPRWEEFSIRVAERDIPAIPRMLEEREGEALEMGKKARSEWERWFSPEAVFPTVVNWCLEMKNARRIPETIARLPCFLQLARPYFFRQYVRTLLGK
jgi:hypothetical protein